jgi:hypothetical protein
MDDRIEYKKDHRKRKLAEGRCARHGELFLLGRRECQKCLDWRNARKLELKIAGRCYNHPVNPLASGRTVCQICLWQIAEAQLFRLYGLTLETFAWMEYEQNRKCANPNCDQPADTVDHDHETGKVRGLLCQGCNRAEGLLGRSVERIRGLATYLSLLTAV